MTIQASFEAYHTRFVRLLWCDNANVIRAKAFHLKQNSLLLEGLGAELAQAFLAMRQAEWEAMKKLSLGAEVELLLRRY